EALMRTKTQGVATSPAARFAACGLLAAFGLLSACSAEPPATWDMDGDGVADPAAPGGTTPGVDPAAPGQPGAPGSPAVTPGAPGSPGVTPGAPGTANPPPTTTPDKPVIPPGDPLPLELDGTPTLGKLVRLTHAQWANSIQQLLALDAPPEAADQFAPDAIVG